MQCFDVLFSRTRNKAEIDLFIRDDQGSYVSAQTQCFSLILGVGKGRAMRLLYALRRVKELHINNVIFELDSK